MSMSGRGGDQKIRVLIADDVPEARDNVQKLLQFAPDIAVVGQAGTGREAVDLARRLNPDIILMDVQMPEMDGIAATQVITAQFPSIAVIMISVQIDPENLRRSLQAGARDYLSKPFGLDDLTNSIRTVYQGLQATRAQFATTSALPGTTGGLGGSSAEAGSKAKVIGTFSPKGGVGRTALAVNLAVATKLATDLRVAVVDGNLAFGDVGVALNLPATKTVADLAHHSSMVDADLVSDVLATHSSGVRVLLAPPTPQDAEAVSPDHLRAVLARMVTMFDYIFVDTRPSFEETQLVLLDASDTVLLVLTQEMTAIKAAKQYLEVSELLGYPGEKTLLVLNRAGTTSQISAEDIEAHLKGRLRGRIPDDPVAVLRSINEGVPLVVSAPESRFAVAINHLASAVTDGAVQVEEEQEQRRGFRFFRRGGAEVRARPGMAVTES
jgi:pilus assembly protein CpaE